jgi:Tol biopolymer transport system component
MGWFGVTSLLAVVVVLHSVPWIALDEPLPDSSPVWSHDGNRIAFDRAQDTGDETWSVDVRTGEDEHPLADDDRDFSDLSPDGRRIVYDEGDYAFVADADGGHARRLDVYQTPVWAGANSLVFTRDSFNFTRTEVVRMDANGSHRRVVARLPYTFSEYWSPQARFLAYTTEWDDVHFRLLRLSDGMPAGRLPVACSSLAWAPDARRIACMAPDGESIDVLEVPTGTRTRLRTAAPSCKAGYGDLAWSPDGKRLAYACGGVWVLDADGQNARQLTRGKE